MVKKATNYKKSSISKISKKKGGKHLKKHPNEEEKYKSSVTVTSKTQNYVNNVCLTTEEFKRVSPEFLKVLDTFQRKVDYLEKLKDTREDIEEIKKNKEINLHRLNFNTPPYENYYNLFIEQDGYCELIYEIDFYTDIDRDKVLDIDKLLYIMNYLVSGYSLNLKEEYHFEKLLEMIRSKTKNLTKSYLNNEKYLHLKLRQLYDFTNFLLYLMGKNYKTVYVNYYRQLFEMKKLYITLLKQTKNPQSFNGESLYKTLSEEKLKNTEKDALSKKFLHPSHNPYEPEIEDKPIDKNIRDMSKKEKERISRSWGITNFTMEDVLNGKKPYTGFTRKEPMTIKCRKKKNKTIVPLMKGASLHMKNRVDKVIEIHKKIKESKYEK